MAQVSLEGQGTAEVPLCLLKKRDINVTVCLPLLSLPGAQEPEMRGKAQQGPRLNFSLIYFSLGLFLVPGSALIDTG